MMLIETRDLRKTYGDLVAVHGLNLDVGAGEVFGFLGPNGAGKTTVRPWCCSVNRARLK